MPNPSTPAQLAALAELLAITPDTHPHCFQSWWKCSECQRTDEYFKPAGGAKHPGYGYWHYHSHAVGVDCGPMFIDHQPDMPCPFSGTLDADDVWLAPLMRWLAKNENEPMVSGSHVNSPCWGCVTSRKGDSDCDGKAYVYSLLHAALSARVSELIAIYPEGIPQ
jgi:hypothetical protein